MRNLADAGYVPAIRMMPSLADLADLYAARVTADHSFKTIGTDMLLRSRKSDGAAS
jgi:hypothetical protein